MSWRQLTEERYAPARRAGAAEGASDCIVINGALREPSGGGLGGSKILNESLAAAGDVDVGLQIEVVPIGSGKEA